MSEQEATEGRGVKWHHTKAVADRYSVGIDTVWRWVRQGYLPQPVYLRPKCPRWSEATLLEWEAKLQGARQ